MSVPGGLLAVRLAVVAGTLLAALFLAANVRSLDAAERGKRELGAARAEGFSPQALARARDDLDAGRRLRPDAPVLVDEGSALVLLGAPGRAVAPLAKATRLEPRNADAWFFLFAATRRSNPAVSREAAGRALALNPRLKAAIRRAGGPG